MTNLITAYAKALQERVRSRCGLAPNWEACDQAYWLKAAEEAFHDLCGVVLDEKLSGFEPATAFPPGVTSVQLSVMRDRHTVSTTRPMGVP